MRKYATYCDMRNVCKFNKWENICMTVPLDRNLDGVCPPVPLWICLCKEITLIQKR